MKKVTFSTKTEDDLIALSEERKLFIEGNILKVIVSSNESFKTYLEAAIEADKDSRRKRLELTKVVQEQNNSLVKKAEENKILVEEIQEALEDAKAAKEEALSDLDLMHKKSQFELINTIVNYALYVIVGTGIVTTALYTFAIVHASGETTLIGNTWSNLFGILLTNSFSIIGTIMGVKYANRGEGGKNEGP